MDVAEFDKFVFGEFGGVAADHPWERTPDYIVYRHVENRKWFAAVLSATREQLMRLKPADACLLEYGAGEVIPIVNLKLEPGMIDVVVSTPGVLPAWHMNRRHWVSVVLDGSVDTRIIAPLVDVSYNLTDF